MSKFDPDQMPDKYGRASYSTRPGIRPALWPTPYFLLGTLLGPMTWLWYIAKRQKLDDLAWVRGSVWLADIFENTGCKIIAEGLENLENVDGPCVFIANHMSTLETFVLPGMIRPHMPVTFVVKKSLTTMPVFGPIMRSRNPIVVGRTNPREDLTTVLEEGTKRLADGISVIVFPQHTRSLDFDPQQFNSIGVKLALKANAAIVPIALKTDAWGQGKKIKELGAIRPELPACFRFGKPLKATGRGKAEHSQICQFIQESLAEWKKEG